MRGRSNAARGDASLVECSAGFTTGCLTSTSSLQAADPLAGAHADAAVAAARWLRISVTRGHRVVVQVCFPSYAVLSLAELVPDDVRTRVIAERVDLEAVAADAAARGCPPGDLFAMTAGDHGVRAWLE